MDRPVLLSDLTEDILWLKMGRGVGLAIRPDRWIMGTLLVAFMGLVLRLAEGTGPGRRLLGGVRASCERMCDEVVLEVGRRQWQGVAGAIGRGMRALLVDLPLSYPLVVLGIVLPVMAVWALVGSASCRSVALEFGQGVLISWPRALGFGISRWKSAMGAMVMVPLVVGVVVLGLAIGGWVLLSWPVVQVVGGIVYPLFMIAALIAVLLMVGMSLGKHLLLPAIACEGTDALDAVQRALAYVAGSPVRLLVYLGLGAAQTVIAGVVILVIGRWTTGLVSWGTTVWVPAPEPGVGEPGWSQRMSDALVGMWHDVPLLLAGGFVVSAYFACSTLGYLLLRRFNDGQDAADLWMPMMAPGTMAEVKEGSGSGGGEFGEEE